MRLPSLISVALPDAMPMAGPAKLLIALWVTWLLAALKLRKMAALKVPSELGVC